MIENVVHSVLLLGLVWIPIGPCYKCVIGQGSAAAMLWDTLVLNSEIVT